MPSVNRTIGLRADRRIRINTCEGRVTIVDELMNKGKWRPYAAIHISREDAERLIAEMADQMSKNF